MYYVIKSDFDEVFSLKKEINNDFITIKIISEDFYFIEHNEELYKRFQKLLDLVYHPGIYKYVRMIKYCKKYNKGYKYVLETSAAKELAKEIDKHILEQVMLMNTKKLNDGS